ncbi:MAG: histidine phosphatase family protein [Ferruginibacter sp.]
MNQSNTEQNGTTQPGKTLLVVRHAKSSWDVGTLNDFERPLNDRGKKDAPVMAQRLTGKKIIIDAFVSSPAKRAKKTAELFCETLGRKTEEIIFITKLYHAPADIFFEVVDELDDAHNTVAVFSHNPGITEFVNLLVPEVRLDNMPTCAVFAVKAPVNKWSDFKKAKKELLFFDYPKLV